MSGDRVLVSRLSYGLRMPWCTSPSTGRCGYRSPQRGDLMAFNLPSDSASEIAERPVIFGRCTALPGDTIYISPKKEVSLRKRKGYYPFVIPGRGMRVKAERWNVSLLAATLSLHEPCRTARLKGDTLTVNGHKVSAAYFTQEYFWVSAASEGDTFDSRYFGLVPESHLIGKVEAVICSIDPSRPFPGCIRTDRICIIP